LTNIQALSNSNKLIFVTHSLQATTKTCFPNLRRKYALVSPPASPFLWILSHFYFMLIIYLFTPTVFCSLSTYFTSLPYLTNWPVHPTERKPNLILDSRTVKLQKKLFRTCRTATLLQDTLFWLYGHK
jgi:hypothetical protein